MEAESHALGCDADYIRTAFSLWAMGRLEEKTVAYLHQCFSPNQDWDEAKTQIFAEQLNLALLVDERGALQRPDWLYYLAKLAGHQKFYRLLLGNGLQDLKQHPELEQILMQAFLEELFEKAKTTVPFPSEVDDAQKIVASKRIRYEQLCPIAKNALYFVMRSNQQGNNMFLLLMRVFGSPWLKRLIQTSAIELDDGYMSKLRGPELKFGKRPRILTASEKEKEEGRSRRARQDTNDSNSFNQSEGLITLRVQMPSGALNLTFSRNATTKELYDQVARMFGLCSAQFSLILRDYKNGSAVVTAHEQLRLTTLELNHVTLFYKENE